MRFDGIIKSWNDERGFGFIEATQGGQEIFVHIKAFRDRRYRPVLNQRVVFEVELGPQGKKRAVNVDVFKVPRTSVRSSREFKPHPWSNSSKLAACIFFVVIGVGYVMGNPPVWLLLAYGVMSLITFLVYASDKSAAQQGHWRVSEKTLHMLALACGWPGALIAQETLRHKSSKAEFRAVFGMTVILNLSAFCFMASSHGQKIFSL